LEVISVLSKTTGAVFDANLTADKWVPKVAPIQNYLEKSGYRVSFKSVCALDSMLVECTISDPITGKVITRFSESDGAARKKPISYLYNSALALASTDFLELVPIGGEKIRRISDEDIILFGSQKGKTFGEVKDTPVFEHFLDQLAVSKLSFDDVNKQAQLEMLLLYNSEVRNAFGD